MEIMRKRGRGKRSEECKERAQGGNGGSGECNEVGRNTERKEGKGALTWWNSRLAGR